MCTMRNKVILAVLVASAGWGLAGVGTRAAYGLVSFSNIEGGFSGSGNINADPIFANVVIGDLRLTLGSPCIDSASNNALPSDVADLDGDGDTNEVLPLDIGGGTRIINNVVDMGAHESGQ